jgi:yeast amino acid transporter
MIAPILFIAGTLVMKSRFIKAEDMDFDSGIAEIEADSYEEAEPRNLWEAVWAKLVRRCLGSPVYYGELTLSFLKA